MAYPREDIERIRDKTDLVELASEVTKVKRSGRTVMAVCPFHQEKTPSLSIDAARGLYHCFGCGKGGDIFAWVQETQSLDFRESIELLARRAGVTLTETPGEAKRRGRREELVRATREAVDFYRERLKSGADAGTARSYLRGRGYGVEVVERFDIGYSPDTWDDLTRHLKQKGFTDKTLADAGLASRSSRGRMIDRFRGRIMFPIFDLRGDPVGFGARLLEGDGPKYLNTSETSIYHKSRLLYGLNWAKSEVVRRNESVVVEGYTDVIALHLAGHPVAVATCGTALGEDHLDLLRRFSERVLLAFDADEAGAGAALRGFDLAIPADLDMRVVVLPEGRDPADLVGEGDAELLVAAMKESQPLLQFSVDRELSRHDLNEAEARGRAVRATAAMVSRYTDPLVQHEYAVLISRRTGVELRLVEDAIAKASRARQRERPQATPSRQRRRLTGTEKAEQELLRLVLANSPELRRLGFDEHLFTPGLNRDAFLLIHPVVMALEPGVAPDLGGALSSSPSDAANLLAELALVDRPLSNAADVIDRLESDALTRRIGELKRAMAGLAEGTQEHSDRFAELVALQQQKKQLRSPE
ncbi:MAG: DNA primase [Acidimicrobiia bacterium]|nr:DNA primase [Acidimicrobiia bacterium]